MLRFLTKNSYYPSFVASLVAIIEHKPAIGNSHPEHLSLCEGGTKRSEPLDVTEPTVIDFVNQLYAEITQLFPDAWVHIGGDEGTSMLVILIP